MFTGLIEAIGRVVDVRATPSGARVRIHTGLAPELRAGDSVAVNGVCLTAVTVDAHAFEADIGPETSRVTTLVALHEDQLLNLERSMRADSRFGGHFVQGHVDGTGRIAQIWPDGDAHYFTIAYDDQLAPYVIPKGSIAVNGVSLTVASLGVGCFDVMIIPFTWTHTNLHALAVGDRVNLECDMIGKYVVRALETSRLKPSPTST